MRTYSRRVKMRIESRANTLPVSTIYLLIGGVWILSTFFLLSERTPAADASRLWEFVLCYLGLLLTGAFLYTLIRHTEKNLLASQDTLYRVNRALESRSDCSQVIVRADDEHDLMVEICRIIVESGGYRLAWVGLAENDAQKTVRPVAQWGHERDYLDTIRISWGENEFGRGPTGIAIRSGHPCVARHIPTDPKWEPWREKALQLGYASSISLPLMEEKRAFGALVIFAGEPDAFDGREFDFLKGLAEDLAFGITTLRLRREKERSRSERMLLATIVEQETDGILTFDTSGVIQYVNPAFESICGYPRDALVGREIRNIEENAPGRTLFQVMGEALVDGQSRFERLLNRRGDGKPYDIETKVSPVCGPSGTTAYAAVVRDLSYQVQLERQLCQAQKMEAIATLAGGIAHDFNNILAAVITNTEMALDDVSPDTPMREHLEIVLKAGLRARSLVRQILTLSCQGEEERQPVRLDLIARECLKLLRATLPTTISLPLHRGNETGLVLADTSQLHQVIMNLCTNAADAMQERGGRLEVGIRNRELTAEDPVQLPAGHYVCLTVSDTGHGMERKTMERIFDPFFTTKGPGRGTGLGLSVVHAIVRNHGGAITVESEPGEGTTFEVFLPRSDAAVTTEIEPSPPSLPRGSERILFLDDEEDLVATNQKMLESLGYTVVAGTDSLEALEIFRAQPDRFDLIITDQTMPHMTGERLALEVLALRPDMPIILCTGLGAYSRSAVTEKIARTIGIREIVMKPTERSEMAGIIRRVLDEKPPAE